MSEQPILEVSDLVKEYGIYRGTGLSLRELAKGGRLRTSWRERFRALDGVSLTLDRGESLAVIGPNGSGKSTLMKIIAGVTPATTGRVAVRGRIAALLEVGSAFQEEYTGIENIYLQCGIMGLSREETERRLPQILDFAELGTFIHTPVKRYSSGMFMRLAFAIASSVDPDLLIVDEVFAVGDIPFQEKCHRRIDEMRAAGTAVLLVTHSYQQATMIASRVIWLESGRVFREGLIEEVLPSYYRAERGMAIEAPRGDDDRLLTISPMLRTGTGRARFISVQFTDERGEPVLSIDEEQSLRFVAEVEVKEGLPEGLGFVVAASSLDRVRTFALNNRRVLTPADPGRYRIEFAANAHTIPAGFYQLGLALYDPRDFDLHHDLILREQIFCITTSDPRRARLERGYAESRPPGRFHPSISKNT